MRRMYLPLIVLCVLVLVSVTGATAQDSQLNAAVTFVADTYGVSADSLTILYETTYEVPAIGEVSHFKMLADEQGDIYGAVVDANGQAYAPDAFRAVAEDAYRQQYGKMDIRLFERFQQNPDEVIPVAIWLTVDDSLYAALSGPDYVGAGLSIDGSAPPANDPFEADRAAPGSEGNQPVERDPAAVAARQALDAAVAGVQDAVAARLAEQGIEVQAVPQTPLLQATLARGQVELVGQDPEVSGIFADDTENVDMNGSAQNTHRAGAVWGRGYTGSGARVAILEDSRAYPNFWLYNFVATRVPGDPNMDNHATETMGNVNSSHALHLGMARDAAMYSANATSYSNSNLMNAAFWAVAAGQDVHIINNSWGPSSPTGCVDTMGIFFDYRAVADRVLVTHSAGNSGNLMGDQAMAFNILAVGSFDDRNNASWWDDSMSSFSAWQEGSGCSPSNGDRNEPDLVAVGQRIRSTRIHPPSIDVSQVQGTSYSAPMVAGEAALVLDIDGNLAWKPEAMRAILMASAVNNIEGNSYRSEYDGAGGIDSYSAYLDALNGRYAQTTINPTTWTYTDFNFYADAGEPVACVATWTSHPNGSYTSDPLWSDIDLRLYNPSGGLVKSSTTVSNNYEIVRTTTGTSGTWKCRVSKYYSTSTWEYLGIAVDRAFQYEYDYPY